MKITNIKPQVKRQERYSVYVDQKYTFSLGELELLNCGLRINQELNQKELDQLQDTAKLDKAYDRALNYLAIRQRSEWELRTYLKRKDYEPELIEQILNKLSVHNYIDDKKFATAWVNTRRLLKTTSKRRLQQELRAKRVSNDIIQQVLTEDQTNDQDTLRRLIERKQHRYPDKLKLIQYLSRQGYNYDDIKSAIANTSTV